MDIRVTVIVRILLLVIALLNQWLSTKGMSPIPENETTVATIVIALLAAWKDNPITEEAKRANMKMKKYKAERKYNNSTGMR